MLTEPWQWALLLFAAFCTGLAKAGFSGISLISVFILADLFGAIASIGIALPMLIIADLCVYPAFKKYGNWQEVWRLLIPAICGMGMAYWFLAEMQNLEASNAMMRRVIGGIILCMIALQLVKKWREAWVLDLAKHYSFSIVAGVIGGLATVLANAAGPIQQLYLLSKQMEKMELIGVGVRFFLLINLLKLPFSASLNLVTANTLYINLWMLPAVLAGIFLGKSLMQRVSQQWFERCIIVFALAAALRLLAF